VGYSVRFESRTSAATRLEVVTTGLFLRRLQADPALEGVACVIFDEFHERQAEADLALALMRQARSLLRPELRLLVMSATLDLAPLAEELDGAAVISCEGRSHPVAVAYQPPRPDERLEHQVLRALEGHWLAEPEPRGTALVFLPGLGELETARRSIADTRWGEALEVALLHGQLPLAAQGRAIGAPRGAAGKVVLATSVAESSLTIAAVTLVIDSGLSRRSRFDPATGMDGLVTQPASQASAEQRRGRAGRLGPGRCVRLWSPAEQQRRPAFDPPELLEVDPLPIVLQLAEWGGAEDEALPWITAPPPRPLAEARDLLRQLGGVDGRGRITSHGRAMARLGLHPRLAHMLLRARERGWEAMATAVAVLLSERDPLDRREAGSDLMRRLDWLRHDRDQEGSGRAPGRGPWTTLQSQLLRQLREGRTGAAPAAIATGSNTAVRDPDEPFGLAIRAYAETPRHDEHRLEACLSLRDEHGTAVPGYGWLFPAGDGTVNIGVGALSTMKGFKRLNLNRLVDQYHQMVREEWSLGPMLERPRAWRLPMSAQRRHGPGWVAVGDAAGLVNPMNGEGIDYGLESGMLATLPTMSQSARSIPAMAVERTIPLPCQKCCRHIICQRCSMRVGSSPVNN
jgi:ATP-dependent helicase HrpB